MSTISSDYQTELNGLLMGHGTSYANRKHVKGLGIPGLRTADVALPMAHGEEFFGDYLSGRSLTFEYHLLADDDAGAEALSLALKGAWAPVDTETTLYLRVAGSEYALVGRPRGCEIGLDRVHVGRIVAICRFECPDPRLYVADLTTLNGTVPSATGGFTFPASADFSFGPGGGESYLVADNEGTIEAPWSATITGPCTNPSLERIGTGQILDFAIELATGDELVLDSADRTVLLNGTTSRYSALSATSTWWHLPPGSTTMAFRADSPTGSIALTFRSAYL